MERSEMVAYLKLLANESRLRLLGLVAMRERSVGELAEIVGLREPTISHHLSRLHSAGLVTQRADGNARLYRLDAGALERMSRDLFGASGVLGQPTGDEAAGWEARVLRSFVEGETLTKIPESRKKRDVVLRWLVERFEEGRSYTEGEVNEIIQRHHADSATLRRELIGARLMSRAGGIYRRE
jgi:hypothetical protein